MIKIKFIGNCAHAHTHSPTEMAELSDPISPVQTFPPCLAIVFDSFHFLFLSFCLFICSLSCRRVAQKSPIPRTRSMVGLPVSRAHSINRADNESKRQTANICVFFFQFSRFCRWVNIHSFIHLLRSWVHILSHFVERLPENDETDE